MDWNSMTQAERDRALATWIAAGGRVEKFVRMMEQPTREIDVDAVAAALDAQLLLPSDVDFPERVARSIETPGPWFVRGRLPPGVLLGVVGCRAVDHEGTRICKQIVRDVAAAGVGIVSGGAIGVDTLAHESALEVGAQTVAVLPSAFDCFTPSRNTKLFGRIASQGALVSEYPPGVSAHRFHFHRRNELIAAMSDAVLVVRAKRKGGTMLTARAAQRIGTRLLAVPGSPEDETAGGCNILLREGARCVTSGDEVLEELGIATQACAPRQLRLDLSSGAGALLDALLDRPRSTDELCATCGLAPHLALVALTELELVNAIESVGGRWRAK